ncbi:hypothetical protein [Streptosporangium sandarakinum]|uniref:hypothetical protein n=1 Tax=Streptosporangium sandarakinum TaxID=1260955 RepID=UPI00371452C3
MTSLGEPLTRFEHLAADLGALRAQRAAIEEELLGVARTLHAAGVGQRLLARVMGQHAAMNAETARKWLQRHGVTDTPAPAEPTPEPETR